MAVAAPDSFALRAYLCTLHLVLIYASLNGSEKYENSILVKYLLLAVLVMVVENDAL